MDRVGCVVIGAGVMGLAVARALARDGRPVLVLERETSFGRGISSRSSEVIHAGLYYEPGSLKARLCVRGKHALLALAQRCGVPHRVCGKLVVATEEGQLAALQTLAERARANGVPVQWCDASQVRRRAPALWARAALWSPTTGIVDSHALMLALLGDLQRAGGILAVGSVFERAEPLGSAALGGWIVRGRTLAGEPFALQAETLVNAAGLWACQVACAVEGPDPARWPQLRYAKGSYFALHAPAPADCLVYPAPQDAWLGVHLTLDLAGRARFGPDLQWLDEHDPLHLDYTVDSARRDEFVEAIRRYWPAVPPDALQPAYAGVRPKIHGPGEPAPDFRIDGPREHGWAGLVHLLGLESPGLTSALALADEVRQRLLQA